MNEKILLSICIPTYNRYNKLKPMLEQLLTCERNDFEIVIQDNCSTDGTQNLMNEIQDDRIRFIKNSENIGGIINGFEALIDAHGKFCMLCLDKDCVLGNKLASFLQTLESFPNIKYGICKLNATSENNNEVFVTKKECFDFFAYKSQHPSGMFWETDLYKNCSIIPRLLKSRPVFGFFQELTFAECISKKSGGLYYKNPLIKTETAEESAKKQTLTYNKSQMFFFPKNRIYEFKVYLGQLETLKFGLNNWLKIFKRGLIISTLGYKRIMQEELHLMHYGIETRKVEMLELISIAFRYTFSIMLTSRKKAFNRLFDEEKSKK